MENFNLNHLIAKFTYKVTPNQTGGAKPQSSPAQNFTPASSSQPQYTPPAGTSSPQMGALGGVDRSVYIKDLMKLPKNMNELMFMLQKNLNQMQFNRMFDAQLAANKNLLSQTQAQILAQLQGLSTDAAIMMKNQLNSQLAASLKDLQISNAQMISIADIAALIQTNGKDAVTKLILAMANASKQGVNDLSQLKETAKLINASIALASTENPSQTLKTLMLLYLPWLPLQEGTGFDLEIETTEGGSTEDSVLIITITTINYGEITATLILETQNSVHTNIQCIETFPKDELLLRLQNEQKHYSMESVISFETKKSFANHQPRENQNAKINMSHTNEISPYLLLAAHSLIRHTIELDRDFAG